MRPPNVATLCFAAILAYALLHASLVVVGEVQQETIIRKTVYGELMGITTGSSLVFRGVPYAKQKRFQPPEPPLTWGPSLVRHALVDGPGCPQINCSTEMPPLSCPPETSENCLFLNVFAPVAQPGNESGHPVMLWIHGGNFRRGFGGGPLYDGQHLANSSSVVIVSINYRLGALGFLTTSTGLDGNYGIMDQRMAMKWVRDNIAFFGGDPNSVTLFGQSAGAMSIATHLASARSAGLYQKVILESEPFGIFMRSREDADRMGADFVKAMDCAEDDLECLQTRPTHYVMNAQTQVSKKIVDLKNLLEIFIPWTPTIDGDQVMEEPLFSFQKGNIADVPMIIGTVSEECVLYIYDVSPVKPIPEDVYNVAMLVKFGSSVNAVKQMYPYNDTGSGDTRDHLSVLGTDYVFRCAVRNATRSVVKSVSRTQPVWRYLFNHSFSFDGWGENFPYCAHRVCHGSELPYVFQPIVLHDRGFSFTPEEQAMSDQLIKHWTNFAHTSNPNLPSVLPQMAEWKTYNTDPAMKWTGAINITAPNYAEFDDANYFSKRCDFWDEHGYTD